MQQITITENSTLQIINAKEETYTGYINYNTTRQGWFLDLIGENFKILGIRITSCPNILRQWSSRLSFGLEIYCEQKSEPFFFEDFNTGRAKIFLLEEDDLYLQDLIYAQIQ